jgi:hypothetical protein
MTHLVTDIEDPSGGCLLPTKEKCRGGASALPLFPLPHGETKTRLGGIQVEDPAIGGGEGETLVCHGQTTAHIDGYTHLWRIM